MYDFELNESKLTFTFQPIVRVHSDGTKEEVLAHEMLLRDSETGRFPLDFFNAQTESEEKIGQLYHYYVKVVHHFLSENESSHLNINIDPKQLLLRETYRYFESLTPFSSRITIEMTEGAISEGIRSIEYIDEIQMAVSFIRKKGFLVALDDVGTGETTFELAEYLVENVDFLKFTILPFSRTSIENGYELLKGWRTFAKSKNIPFIVEGIESVEQAEKFAHAGYTLQQGYYWNDNQ